MPHTACSTSVGGAGCAGGVRCGVEGFDVGAAGVVLGECGFIEVGGQIETLAMDVLNDVTQKARAWSAGAAVALKPIVMAGVMNDEAGNAGRTNRALSNRAGAKLNIWSGLLALKQAPWYSCADRPRNRSRPASGWRVATRNAAETDAPGTWRLPMVYGVRAATTSTVSRTNWPFRCEPKATRDPPGSCCSLVGRSWWVNCRQLLNKNIRPNTYGSVFCRAPAGGRARIGWYTHRGSGPARPP